MRDTLFLLQPGFVDPRLSQDRYYCTECAALEGVLSFTAPLRERLEVRRIGFERPGTPATGRQFITGLVPIGEYLATQYGIPRPHP